MDRYEIEKWTVEELASALRDMHKDNKVIAVPMFQRGKRWNQEQQKALIDSLKRGFPVGTMLFYKKIVDGKETYVLVDGLQRGDAIKKYMNDPTQFFCDVFSESNIADEFYKNVLTILNVVARGKASIVRSTMTDFIKSQRDFNNLQYFLPAKTLVNKLSDEADESARDALTSRLIDAIQSFFKERQKHFNEISQTTIPVIVYTGSEESLPEIFERINSKGTALDQYELYAAVWPMQRNLLIENASIVETVIRKYNSFIEDGFTVYDYDGNFVRSNRMLNAFEYLFGLGKFLVKKYDILAFASKKEASDDAVSTLGFELVNVCLNDSDKIGTLYRNINATIDINAFEKALYYAIDFVAKSIAPITRFKGNNRGTKKLFHSKFQILSMIAGTFKEMFRDGVYSEFSPSWNERKDILSRNLIRYYVYDILVDIWRAGGTKSIYSYSKRYMSEIPARAWRTALDGFFEKSMSRSEGTQEKGKQIPNPKSGEYVLLNCIYLNTFTAMDQLSIASFDVEHIAPKEQMKRLIALCHGRGLPISCIANLCYLPEYENRSKKSKNFYQDEKYLQNVDILEIERKYSFTVREDLEWMDMSYESPEDFDALRQFYVEFCTKRFSMMKKLFCDSMQIDYDAMIASPEEGQFEMEYNSLPSMQRVPDFYDECIERVESAFGSKLIKVRRSTYKTQDGKAGYLFRVSRAYNQGNRERYWFAYDKNSLDSIDSCSKQYIVYGCKDAHEILCIPAEIIESRTNRMTFSLGENGEISHWHVYFFRNSEGDMVQLLTKPVSEEIDINQYKI